jgi:copper chaperone for superoxide dismutase
MDKIFSRVEFAVQIKSSKCVDEIKERLDKCGIKSEEIVPDSENKELRIVLHTTQPWIELQEKIESTGRRVVLVGFSEQSAVAMLDKGDVRSVKGVIRFCSITKGKSGIVLDGVVDGIQPKHDHLLSIHEFGDVSSGCASLGEVYKNASYLIKSNEAGRATIRTVDHNLQVSDLIGRSVGISSSPSSSSDTFVCGIISRAAGIFQNWKRICACDGVTIWDERDRPLAGKGRRV